MRRLWKHSIATAVIGEALAPTYGALKESASIAGILHDLGRIGLIAAYPDRYSHLVTASYDHNAAVLEEERTQFGLDHCAAGAKLTKAWRLPAIFRDVTGSHHDVPASGGVIGLIQVACLLADGFHFCSIFRADQSKPAETIAAFVPEQVRAQVTSALEGVEQHIVSRIEALDF